MIRSSIIISAILLVFCASNSAQASVRVRSVSVDTHGVVTLKTSQYKEGIRGIKISISGRGGWAEASGFTWMRITGVKSRKGSLVTITYQISSTRKNYKPVRVRVRSR